MAARDQRATQQRVADVGRKQGSVICCHVRRLHDVILVATLCVAGTQRAQNESGRLIKKYRLVGQLTVQKQQEVGVGSEEILQRRQKNLRLEAFQRGRKCIDEQGGQGSQTSKEGSNIQVRRRQRDRETERKRQKETQRWRQAESEYEDSRDGVPHHTDMAEPVHYPQGFPSLPSP